MKLFSYTLIALLFAIPSIFAFKLHNQNLPYTHPYIVVKDDVSYKTLKDVPAGIAITATNYWTPLLASLPSSTPPPPPSGNEPPTVNSLPSNPPPDTNDTEPEEELDPGVGQVAIDDPNYAVPSYGTRIVNISTRGKVVGSASDDALVGGFVMRGTPGAIKTVIVRGLGPYMSGSIDSSLLLADPYIEVFNSSGVKIASNDNWKEQYADPEGVVNPDPSTTLNNGNYAGWTTSFAGVGLNDKEAGLLLDLEISSNGFGIYTVYLYGTGGSTGVGQVAIDDPDYSANGSGNRIVNISTRGYVGTGDYEDLVGGFVLFGPAGDKQNYILRGLGPYMKITQNKDIYITDPFMTVEKNGPRIASNDNWATQYTDSDSTVVNPNPATTLNNGSYAGWTNLFAGEGVGLQTKESGVLLNLEVWNGPFGIYTNTVKLSAP